MGSQPAVYIAVGRYHVLCSLYAYSIAPWLRCTADVVYSYSDSRPTVPRNQFKSFSGWFGEFWVHRWILPLLNPSRAVWFRPRMKGVSAYPALLRRRLLSGLPRNTAHNKPLFPFQDHCIINGKTASLSIQVQSFYEHTVRVGPLVWRWA